ncbi:hypothetical protein BGX38DRAFT_414496 [Terfezia claveryi]|nr:hypothetical protein BGX38DRAFT_414496 [Terfezia claveryi]
MVHTVYLWHAARPLSHESSDSDADPEAPQSSWLLVGFIFVNRRYFTFEPSIFNILKLIDNKLKLTRCLALSPYSDSLIGWRLEFAAASRATGKPGVLVDACLSTFLQISLPLPLNRPETVFRDARLVQGFSICQREVHNIGGIYNNQPYKTRLVLIVITAPISLRIFFSFSEASRDRRISKSRFLLLII